MTDMMVGDRARILARVASLAPDADYADFRASGLLFHGTAEPIQGDLRPGDYDRVFWTAETPSVAQAYIPTAGISTLLAKPSGYRLTERIIPNQSDHWADIMHQMGFWPREVDYDACGRATGWTIDPGHPTYGDAMEFLGALGYDFSDGSSWAPIDFSTGRNRFMRADWRKQGSVYVTLRDGLAVRDLRDGLASDLVDPAHVKTDLFAKLEDTGHQAIVIDDYAQVGTDHENVGHVSIGIFAGALKSRSFLKFPAVHCDFRGHKSGSTPEFRAFQQSL